PFAVGLTVGFSVTLIFSIAFFMIARLSIKGEINADFYLLLGLLILLIAYAVALVITGFNNKKAFSLVSIIGGAICGIYGLALLFMISKAGGDYKPLSSTGMYIFSFLLIAVIAVLCIVFGKDKGSASPTKSVAFAGVTIALSFALSYIKLFSLPQGGSVTLASMLPLIIYAYVFGARKGLFAGVIYGVLQCLQSPQIYEPMQVLIDYPVAFGAIGLAGIANKFTFTESHLVKFIIGASFACVGRYVSHVISGYYVFSSWAFEGYTALSWALVYNLFVIVELAIIMFVGVILFSSKSVTKQIETINPVNDLSDIDNTDNVENSKNDNDIPLE
ncbi:MAG: energy-coupled thiamine transporter ThiT, partial [Clostridia bacterium]|nr:energy-coupled thiamine transporter ThiT [Clostridia bacterium]